MSTFLREIVHCTCRFVNCGSGPKMSPKLVSGLSGPENDQKTESVVGQVPHTHLDCLLCPEVKTFKNC